MIALIFSRKIFLPLLVLLIFAAAGCSSSQKVEVSILEQSLPANSLDTPVEIYWSTRSIEAWLKLPGNPEKAPDLGAIRINDTHSLWENVEASKAHGKVADMEVSGSIHLNHPREWLLLDLGAKARELGAHAVVVNSLQVSGLTGQASRDDTEALFKGGATVKVWVYGQAFRYE